MPGERDTPPTPLPLRRRAFQWGPGVVECVGPTRWIIRPWLNNVKCSTKSHFLADEGSLTRSSRFVGFCKLMRRQIIGARGGSLILFKYDTTPAYLTEPGCVRLSLRLQVVVAVFGPSQPATWSYHVADCQPTAPVRSVSLVQSAGMPYRTI